MAGKQRVLSGIQASGNLHLGNYLGAIRHFVADQDTYENFFFIANLHAMTVAHDPEEIRSRTLDVAAWYLACGIDAQKSTIFVQSQIPAHAELAWIMQCYAPMGWMERMTQYKDKLQKEGNERLSTGFFTYPALMAADILLYRADFVPVGDDQRQHIELCRDIAQRFNSLRGDVFAVPKALIRDSGARVMGLDDPEVKMSKSVAESSPGHAVFLGDDPNTIRKKFKRAVTDAMPMVEKPLGPGVANLIDIYASALQLAPDDAYERVRGMRYGELKGLVGDTVAELLEPIQQRHAEIRGDEDALLAFLSTSAESAGKVAEVTLRRAYDACGLLFE